jgi:23S rRNA (adenine2503-C2)-methyltransferase
LEKRHPLPEVLSALKRFNQSGGKRITFEYTMIRGVNDALELIAPLVELARSVEAYVNLIPFNPIPYQNWEPSELHRIKNFAKNLNKHGVPAAIRETRGRDIDAACGQLKAHALVQLEKPRQS